MSPAEQTRAVQAALQHHSANRLQDAERGYRAVLDKNPKNPHALHLLGALAGQVGNAQAALDLFRQAIEVDGNQFEFHSNYSNALCTTRQYEEAIVAAKRAIELKKDFAPAWNNLSLALWNLKRLDEAKAAATEALRLNPQMAEAQNNLALVYRDSGDTEGAILALEKAVQMNPRFASAFSNMAECLWAAGRYFEGVDAAAHAVAIEPDPDRHWNLALSRLLVGDLRRGFIEHEWRWQRPMFYDLTPPIAFKEPWWDGTDLTGKTILLHSEQGYGDSLHFIRYAALVRSKNPARVLLQCQPSLQRLLATASGIDEVFTREQTLPDFDVHLPLLSMPHRFGTDLDTIPAPEQYLHADAEAVAKWKERLAAEQGSPYLRVGLCWAGRPTHTNDKNRSMPLATLAPLAGIEGVRFYGLQKGDAAEQAKTPPAGMDLRSYAEEWTDFADTAAFVANLDLVITIDSSPAHLAAALGRPVWTMLPRAMDWRWLLNRPDTPWYPTMRLFRQGADATWGPVVERITRELRRLVPSAV